VSPPRPRHTYVGGRLPLAEALRGHAGNLRELGEQDDSPEDKADAATLELLAERITRRGRDEITREFPLPLPERKDS
jgi:hypothetical protein